MRNCVLLGDLQHHRKDSCFVLLLLSVFVFLWRMTFPNESLSRGVARIFQRGGHTGSNNIVMAFSPRNIVGRLLKKGIQRGGVTGTPGPPWLRPCYLESVIYLFKHATKLRENNETESRKQLLITFSY